MKNCTVCGNEFDEKYYKAKLTCSSECLSLLKSSKQGEAASHHKHGFARNGQVERLHGIWRGLLKRCYCTTTPYYKNYGGRGIRVCDEWKRDYVAFRTWCLGHGYSKELSIDRIDNNGDYSPSNCKWSTKSEQARNRRTTAYFTVGGVTKKIHEWMDVFDMSYSATYYRLKTNQFVLPPHFELA
jgi:hypothetical protein